MPKVKKLKPIILLDWLSLYKDDLLKHISDKYNKPIVNRSIFKTITLPHMVIKSYDAHPYNWAHMKSICDKRDLKIYKFTIAYKIWAITETVKSTSIKWLSQVYVWAGYPRALKLLHNKYYQWNINKLSLIVTEEASH